MERFRSLVTTLVLVLFCAAGTLTLISVLVLLGAIADVSDLFRDMAGALAVGVVVACLAVVVPAGVALWLKPRRPVAAHLAGVALVLAAFPLRDQRGSYR